MMAENKKSFILYANLIHTVKKLPLDKAGELFLTILSYVNDENPVVDDILIDLVFEPIKQQLKIDLTKWEGEKDTRSDNGIMGNLKRWHIDLYKKVKKGEIKLKDALIIAKNRKVSGSDISDEKKSPPIANIAVNVNDNVNVNVNENIHILYSNGLSKYLKDEFEERKVTDVPQQKYFDMVVKEMNNVWMKWKPGYSFLQEADYPALLRIAYLIAQRKNISRYETVNVKEDEIIKAFDKIAEFMANTESKFFKKLALSGIANPKNFQSIEEEMRTAKQSDKQQQLEEKRITPEQFFTK